MNPLQGKNFEEEYLEESAGFVELYKMFFRFDFLGSLSLFPIPFPNKIELLSVAGKSH